MARIYRTTDRVKYKIGEVEIEISPLDVNDKAILFPFINKGITDAATMIKGSAWAIKMGVKSIKGLEYPDGSPYQLDFESNGKHLTDACVDDLMNIQESSLMIALCSQLINTIPSKLPEGITLVEGDKVPNEQKATE